MPWKILTSGGDSIMITSPSPGAVQLDPNLSFTVVVQVDTIADHFVSLVWATTYLSTDPDPQNAIGTQALAQIGTSNCYTGQLTVNGCDAEFGIVATAELEDQTSTPIDPVNCDSGLVYTSVCSEVVYGMKKAYRRPPKKAPTENPKPGGKKKST